MMRMWLVFLLCLLSFSASAQSWPDLSTQPRSEGGGENDTAVIVGISEYAYLPSISGASDNANDWYLWLSKVKGIPASQMTLLRDELGVREAVLDAVSERVTQAEKKDGTFWFVFIGHGAPLLDQEGNRDGILVGADTQSLSKSLSTRGVRQSELFEILKKSKKSVVLLDSCFSGKSDDGNPLLKDIQPLVAEPEFATGNAVVLTAAKSNEYARHGPQNCPKYWSLSVEDFLPMIALNAFSKQSLTDSITVQFTLFKSTVAYRIKRWLQSAL
jgi:hypothetical protein